MNTQHSMQQSDLDVMPALKMYLDSLEAWKKNYENFAGESKNIPNSHASQSTKATDETALADWSKSGTGILKQLVDQQVELCRFFGNRWEQYLKLTQDLARCRTPAELGQVQAAFVTQFATDYVRETTKLSKPLAEMMSSWPASWRK